MNLETKLNEYKNNKNNAKVYYERSTGKSPEMEVSKAISKILKPKIKNKIPKVLSLFSGVFLINSSILLILDGKMAINKPSKKKINPIAVSYTHLTLPTKRIV